MERHLISASYSYGGGEFGDSMSITIRIINNEQIQLEYYNQPRHDARAQQKSFTMPRAAIEKLERFIEESRFYEIPDKGYESLMVLDGSTGSYNIGYSDDTEFYFGSTLMKNEKDSAACIAFKQYLTALYETREIPEIDFEMPQQFTVSHQDVTLTFNSLIASATEAIRTENAEWLKSDNGNMYFVTADALNCPEETLTKYVMIPSLVYDPADNTVTLYLQETELRSKGCIIAELDSSRNTAEEAFVPGTYTIE